MPNCCFQPRSCLCSSPGAIPAPHPPPLPSTPLPTPTADDSFRSKFLWGRKPMLAACAARLREGVEGADMVWVDLGGGTGENVDLMAQYMDLSRFKKIYVVDLCHSLCEQVRRLLLLRW